MIIHGDCLRELQAIKSDSIDTIITDPPYGYSFMGRDWDKAVPSIEIWRECLRVLKPGAFACVMSAPRSDVQQVMTARLIEAGFRLDFTPIYWTYATGFPKAMNLSKKAAELDGSYAGFQPKPAVEVVIVAMKRLSEKTLVEQALKNGKGVTWLDDGRIPTGPADDIHKKNPHTVRTDASEASRQVFGTYGVVDRPFRTSSGRFPANLLVSDGVLSANDSYSRYFDLDKWYEAASRAIPTFPFLVVPKASRRERNQGLDGFEEKMPDNAVDRASQRMGLEGATGRGSLSKPRANHHPTVKPLKLMSYLITLFSRPGDSVLDPFVGSGTTVIAANQLGRDGIGIEREAEYAEIARARLAHATQINQGPMQAELFKDDCEKAA